MDTGNTGATHARDTYLALVNSGLTKGIAGKLGLPRPAILRRNRPGDPLVPGPVLVLGEGAAAGAAADILLGWGLEVRRHGAGSERIGAIVLALDSLRAPADLSAPALATGVALRELMPGGRIVAYLHSAGDDAGDPARAAARRGAEGFLRSLGRELRGGATANGIVLGGETLTACTSSSRDAVPAAIDSRMVRATSPSSVSCGTNVPACRRRNSGVSGTPKKVDCRKLSRSCSSPGLLIRVSHRHR